MFARGPNIGWVPNVVPVFMYSCITLTGNSLTEHMSITTWSGRTCECISFMTSSKLSMGTDIKTLSALLTAFTLSPISTPSSSFIFNSFSLLLPETITCIPSSKKNFANHRPILPVPPIIATFIYSASQIFSNPSLISSSGMVNAILKCSRYSPKEVPGVKATPLSNRSNANLSESRLSYFGKK